MNWLREIAPRCDWGYTCRVYSYLVDNVPVIDTMATLTKIKHSQMNE